MDLIVPPGADDPRACRTADGYRVTDGLVVWDYDLKVSVVSYSLTFWRGEVTSWWDGWFSMVRPNGDRAPIMNGERMRRFHPRTGEEAK